MKLFPALIFLVLPLHAQSPDEPALAAATHELCSRQIVMLGEAGNHGDGHTLAFKVALVQRLVTQCGFDQVLFESSHYECLHLDDLLRTHQPVTPEQLSAAVGGLWKFDEEFKPLVPFLLTRAQTGKLALGGIDDQLGQSGQDYTNVQMFADLSAMLSNARRQDCSLLFHRRLFNDYPDDQGAAMAADTPRLQACLAEMSVGVALSNATDVTDKSEQKEIIASAQRWIARDYPLGARWFTERDRSMFQNFQWLLSRNPQRRKTIVWAATVHIAKQGPPENSHSNPNFGSYVHQRFGDRAFSLGFAALIGTYREGRTVRQMPSAPPDSIEAHTLRGRSIDAVFLGPSRLSALGILPGAIFQHNYQTLPWADSVDGLVIFRKEQPPTSNR